jgi:hypothetical protein
VLSLLQVSAEAYTCFHNLGLSLLMIGQVLQCLNCVKHFLWMLLQTDICMQLFFRIDLILFTYCIELANHDSDDLVLPQPHTGFFLCSLIRFSSLLAIHLPHLMLLPLLCWLHQAQPVLQRKNLVIYSLYYSEVCSTTLDSPVKQASTDAHLAAWLRLFLAMNTVYNQPF